MSESKIRTAAKAAGLSDPNPRDPSYVPGRELDARQRRLVKDAVRTRAVTPAVMDEKTKAHQEKRRLRIAAQRPRYARKRDRIEANRARQARYDEAARIAKAKAEARATSVTTVTTVTTVTVGDESISSVST